MKTVFVENLNRLNRLHDALRDKAKEYEEIRRSLDAQGCQFINDLHLENECVRIYIERELKIIIQEKIAGYKRLSEKLTLEDSDLKFIEDFIDVM